MQQKFINFHSHITDDSPSVLTLRNIHQNEREQIFPTNFEHCSVGLHPWFLEKKRLTADFDWLEKSAVLPQVVAIGEAGLDKLVEVPVELQEQVFRRQVEISERVGKPMILHCVRAHDQLLNLKKEISPRQNWIFHGFDKHPNMAQRLLDAGCFLSFGAAIFKEKSHAAAALIATPNDRFFLETDDKYLKIRAVYERAALLRCIDLVDLQKNLTLNANLVLNFSPQIG